MYRILFVEDDVAISEMIRDYLTNEGFEVILAHDGREGIETFRRETFDLVLLDLMLPYIDGMAVMRKIREQSVVPILIVSAKGSEADKAVGLGFGADDYIVKPFSLVELAARIKAHVRRVYAWQTSKEEKVDKTKEDTLKVGDLQIDLNNFSVLKHTMALKLTSKEFEILRLFITNPNRVFTKAQIYERIWQEGYYGDENVINVHIRRLREKIEDDPKNPTYIKTLWGIGYKLEEF